MRIYFSGVSPSNDPRNWADDVRIMRAFDGKVNKKFDGCDFLDSGAFTLRKKPAGYFRSREHRKYLDDYADFIRKHSATIGMYANVDVIGNAALTWRNQQYLETQQGLTPIPAVHRGSQFSWLARYLDAGHSLVGLGGLAVPRSSRIKSDERRGWLTAAFGMLANMQVHGFGVTNFNLMASYPWTTVDSTTWVRQAGYGKILVPRLAAGQFDFSKRPYELFTDKESPFRKLKGRHFLSLAAAERVVVERWLELIGVPVAAVQEVAKERNRANVLFFLRFCEYLATQDRVRNPTHSFGLLGEKK